MISLVYPPERKTKKVYGSNNSCSGHLNTIGCYIESTNFGYEIKWKVNIPDENMLCRIAIADSNIINNPSNGK